LCDDGPGVRVLFDAPVCVVGCAVFHVTIDGFDDAKGGVFAQQGLLLIQGHEPRTETKRLPEFGGGADQMFMYDEYAFAERQPNATSVHIREVYSDATAPA